MTGPTRPLRRAAPPRRGDPAPSRRRDDTPAARSQSRRHGRPSRWTAVTGVVAGGLVVLAIALAASWALATRLGVPGPEPALLAWHVAAAAAVLVAQVRADRSGRPGVALAACGVALAVLGLLWFG